MTTTLIIRDQYGIHPDRQKFVEEKLREIAEHFRQLKLVEMSGLERVWLIGQALNDLKPEIYEGQWQNFCHDQFKDFSQSSIRKWMQLAKLQPALLKKFRPQLSDKSNNTSNISLTKSTSYVESEQQRTSTTKSTSYVSNDDLPGIGAALKIVKGWMREHRKQKRPVTKKSPPREYCPHCGQFLSKRVKLWMSKH